jgi:RNA polymerase sigma-70 factor (sigma-E family)
VRSSASWLLRNAYLLTGDAGAAEELVQLTLFRTSRRWRVACRAPEPYARRVLVNLARDRHRHSIRSVAERPLEHTTAQQRVDDRGDHVEILSARSAVFQALNRLPLEQREVLVLRFYGDLSVAETAAALGTSEGTVKSRTSRALSRMRELLAEPSPAEEARTPIEVSDDNR